MDRDHAPGTPLFGLRWVPDGALRPLRYLPNPAADELRPSSAAAPSPGTPKETSTSEALRLHQSVRALSQRLEEAQETVRQKSEQIRWLKEMTKDEARRTRVAR